MAIYKCGTRRYRNFLQAATSRLHVRSSIRWHDADTDPIGGFLYEF